MTWWRKKKSYPAFYLAYLEKVADKGFCNDILSLDLETTGLDPKKHEILSIGSIPIIQNKVLPGLGTESFFKVEGDIKNVQIHEILPSNSLHNFKDYIPEFFSQLGNKKILGHFISMDIAFLNNQLKRMNLPKIKNPTIDTLTMALKYDGINQLQFASKEKYTLYSLCTRFGIPISTTHNALEDAYLTALLYLHLK